MNQIDWKIVARIVRIRSSLVLKTRLLERILIRFRNNRTEILKEMLNYSHTNSLYKKGRREQSHLITPKMLTPKIGPLSLLTRQVSLSLFLRILPA